MLLVNHCNNRYLLLKLRHTRQTIQRSVLLVVTNHHGIVLIDALPVNKQHVTRLQTLTRIYFIKHHRVQPTRLREEIAHAQITLLVQLIRRYPYISHIRVLAFTITHLVG